MDKKIIKDIEDKIHYHFHQHDLLQQAFTRRSYAMENEGTDNEILEFIGDKALDIIIIKILMEKFGYMLDECEDFDPDEDYDEFYCDYTEGELTEMKKQLVQKKTLAQRIDVLHLSQYLIMGQGDELHHINNEDSVKEDLFEAIIGAIVIDSKWNFKRIQTAIEAMFDLDTFFEKYTVMNTVLEWANQKQLQPSHRYHKTIEGWGSTRTGEAFKNLDFCLLSIGHLPSFEGQGSSQEEAKYDAYDKAYKYLESHHLLSSIKNEIENPNEKEAINQLETLARRGYFSLPIYTFKQTFNHHGDSVWSCSCRIKEYEDQIYQGYDYSKKSAKKKAAFAMLNYVLR